MDELKTSKDPMIFFFVNFTYSAYSKPQKFRTGRFYFVLNPIRTGDMNLLSLVIKKANETTVNETRLIFFYIYATVSGSVIALEAK